jgi:hypothetical protein
VDIQTAFESRRIIIRNLPLHTSETALLKTVEELGELKTANVYQSGSSSTAHVTFLDHRSAQLAVESLHNSMISDHTLSAQLDLRLQGLVDKAVLRSTKVRATWFAPATIAWAHYGSISQARNQAERLNGATFNGLKLLAAFQPPTPRQRDSFSVAIKGLPLKVKHADLKAFCGARSVDIKRPQQTLLAQENVVHALLDEQGYVDAFETLPAREGVPKVSAIAQFATPEEAIKAVSSLHTYKQAHLNQSPLYLEIIHTLKYQLRPAQFQVLLPEIERITAVCEGVKIRWYDVDAQGQPVDPVVLRAHAPKPQQLSVAKHELDSIFRGQVLCHDGSVLWDSSWDRVQEPEILRSVARELGVALLEDRRTRTVRFYGDAEKRQECEGLLQTHLLSLQHAGTGEVFQTNHQTHNLIMNKLSDIRKRLGDACISYDAGSKSIKMNGDPDQIRVIRKALERVIESGKAVGVTTGDQTDLQCPVCMCDVDEDSYPLACGHTYCRSCLKFFLESCIDQDAPTPIACIHASSNNQACSTPIHLSVIRELLPPEQEEALLKRTFLTHANSLPNEYHYCPTPDCEMIYRRGNGSNQTVLTCPSCLNRICPACCVGFHEGLTCAEYKDEMSGGYKALLKWKEENGIKACPKCGADIEKDGGCNHMTCARCKTHMCWVCMKTFGEDRRGGESVYDHMNRVHGGIGVGGF